MMFMLGLTDFLIIVLVLLFARWIWQFGNPPTPYGRREAENRRDENPQSTTGDFERIVDFVLNFVAHRLSSRSSAQPLPNLDISIADQTLFIPVEYQLLAKNGVMEGLSTLRRDGPASTIGKSEIMLNAAAGFRKLVLRYGQYSLKGGFVNVSGKLEVKISPLTLRMVVSLKPPFNPELRSLDIESLGTPQVSATGLGLFGFLVPHLERKLEQHLANLLPPYLRSTVDDAFRNFSSSVSSLPQVNIFGDIFPPQKEISAKLDLPAIENRRKANELQEMKRKSDYERKMKEINSRSSNSTIRRNELSSSRGTDCSSIISRRSSDVSTISSFSSDSYSSTRHQMIKERDEAAAIAAGVATVVGVGAVIGLAAWAFSGSSDSNRRPSRGNR